MHRRIQALVDSLDIPLLTGAVDTAPARDGRPRYRNRVRLFLPGASPPDARSGGAADASLAYDKHHLVPFAEHVPLVDDWPALQRLSVPAGGVAGYVRGPGPVLFSIPTRTPGTPVRVAPLICFETVVGPYVQTAAEKADVIVAVSQVGWWGTSGILPQYRALTRLRALETGRPIVVATVTGPSFVARPDGTVDVLTDWMSSTTSHAAIPISR
jgi:apolipoprotein N-acyltransferase